MFDMYIFKYGQGNESGVTQYWYQGLWVIRREALKAGIPYWAWMQTWDRPAERGYNVRLPSDSDYRMNVFSALTYGFTGIADFMYCGGHKRDLLMPDGTPSPLYAPAAKVHEEVGRIGRTLRFLTSTNVAFLPGSKESRRPTFLKDWAPGAAGDRQIKALKVLNGGQYANGLVGHFTDDAGQTYFMLTNLHQHAHKSAAECELRIRMTFSSHGKGGPAPQARQRPGRAPPSRRRPRARRYLAGRHGRPVQVRNGRFRRPEVTRLADKAPPTGIGSARRATACPGGSAKGGPPPVCGHISAAGGDSR